MESKSSLTLLAIVIAFTLALVGLCANWDRIGLVAPFGDADLAPFIFIPLLLASLYAAVRWFGFRPSMPTVAIRFASLFALSTCILVVTLLPAEPPTKLIVSSMLVAITIVLQITISRDWFPSAPRKRESGE